MMQPLSDDIIARLQQRISADGAEKLKRMGEAVLKLNENPPAPLSDLAAGFEKAAQAGIDAAEAMEGVREGDD